MTAPERETIQPAAPGLPGSSGAAATALTPAELRVEAWLRSGGLLAGPLILLGVWAAPLPLPTDAHRLAAIISFVVAWWVTGAVPLAVTALLGSALTVVAGVAGAQDVFAPFATPVIFLFIGSFMIGRAIAVHRLDMRLAHALLSSRLVRGRPSRVPIALGLLTVVISGWMSGTATTAMMAPLALGVLATARASIGGPARASGRRMMLTIAYAASVGSMLTPVGAPSNLVALGFLDQTAGVRVEFFTWMLIGVPLTIVMTGAVLAVTALAFPGQATEAGPGELSPEGQELNGEPWTAGQRNCLIGFTAAASLWVTPGLVTLVSGPDSEVAHLLTRRLDMGTVAILAAALLFVLPTNWKAQRFTLEWQDASRIDWGTILMFGGGLSLGHQMFATGLAEILGTGLIALSGSDSLWAVTGMALAATIAMSQITSNTATAAMLTPVVLSICAAAGLNPVPPALGVAFGSGIPFLLPISSPPNAIAYGTGLIPVTAMMKVGLILNIVGFVTLFAGLRILCPLLGLA